MPLSTFCSSAALTCQPRGKSWSTWTFKAATRRQVKLRQPDLDDYTRTGRARAVGGHDAGCWSFLKRRSFLQKPLAWDEPTLGWLKSSVGQSVRPSPLPTAASRKAAERPRAVSRVELSVVESRSNSFRRSPEHLWPCRSCRRRQGQTCTHDSRDDLLQSRAVRTTRSTGWSNSGSAR